MENQDEIVSYFQQVVEIRMKEKKQEKKRKVGSTLDCMQQASTEEKSKVCWDVTTSMLVNCVMGLLFMT